MKQLEHSSSTPSTPSSRSSSLWIVLLVGACVVIYAFTQMHQPTTAPATAPVTPSHSQKVQSNAPGAPGHSIYGKPSLPAGQIDAILKLYQSPAAGLGQTLYDLSVQYGIDDGYPLAFFMHESLFGTQGMARVTHSLGNLRCIDGAACVNNQGGTCESGQSCYASFPTWAAGFKAWFTLITSELYKGDGLTTVETIIPRYAPNADNNNETAYMNALIEAVSEWKQGKEVF